jgi:hypothetical protein
MKKILILLLILTACSPIHLVIDEPAPQLSRAVGWQTMRAKQEFRDSTNFKKLAEFEDGARIGNYKTGSQVTTLDSIVDDGTDIYFYKGATILTAVPGMGGAAWGTISGTLANQIDLQNALNLKGSGTLVAHDTTHLSARINLKGSGTLVAHDTTHLSARINLKANTSHTQAQTTIAGLPDSLLNHYTKAQTDTRLNLKANTTTLSGYVPTSRTVNGYLLTGNISITAADVSLGNVTNESKATMFTSPTLTGTPLAPTAAAGTSTTQIATTAFVTTKTDLIDADLADYEIGIAASDTALMLIKYPRKLNAALTGVPTAPTATSGTNTTQLATTAFVNGSNTTLLAYQAMGSVIKALPIGTTISMVGSDLTMTDGRIYFIAVYLSTPQTIMGVKFQSHTAGDYVADNYNGVGLYSVSAGTLTLVASSTDNDDLWKGVVATNITQAFSAPYAASAGLYYIAAVWNTSDAVPTAVPHIKMISVFGVGSVQTFDFTNSLSLVSYLAAATLPTPTQLASGLSIYTGGVPFITLY